MNETSEEKTEEMERKGLFDDLYHALFGDSWEMWIGSILVSMLSILLFVMASPLGSIGGLNNIGLNILTHAGFSFSESAPSGIPVIPEFLYAMLVVSVFIGAAGGALLARQFAIRLSPWPEMMKGLVGGILMGVGGSIGMGCTISGFYSSLPALSAGGLFFGAGLFVGVYAALRYLIWESVRFPFLTEGKWTRYLAADGQKSHLQPLTGSLILLLGISLIFFYDPSTEIDLIGFIIIGILIGMVLQRSRFCIFRAIREPFLNADPKPAQAIIAGLLVGLVGFIVIKGAGQGEEYSFIFPNFWLPGLIGGVIFGIGMTAAGGCSISSTWRAAEGSVKHWFALLGITISMPLTGEYLKPGFLDLIPGSTQRAEFLPDTLGYGGSVFLILLMLFLWYVMVTWNERNGFLLLVGRAPPGSSHPEIPMPDWKDAFTACLIAILLVSGTLVFTFHHQWTHEDDMRSADEMIHGRIIEYLFPGKPAIISAPELYSMLDDGFPGNDPMIISLRSESSYRLGHIPGAERIDYRDVFGSEQLSGLPMNRPIVLVSDSSHLSGEISSLLSIMGFQALSLEWGMASWTSNTTIAGDFYDPSEVDDGYPVIPGTKPGTLTRGGIMQSIGQCGFVEPRRPDTTDVDEEEVVRAVIEKTMLSTNATPIRSHELLDLLPMDSPMNDPFVLDLRSPPRYQGGHIPGAVNMDLETMFMENTLHRLPQDGRMIVVVADTILLESQARAFLSILGYEARSLEFGMASWTSDPDIAPVQYDRTTDCNNYPVYVGSGAGAWGSSVIAGKTREDILLEAAVSLGAKGPQTMNATELFALLNDTDPENDPLIYSLQEPDLYATGHIPGALNIQTTTLFSREHLMSLFSSFPPSPTPQQSIVIVDSDGQQASGVAVFLDLLGFEAFYLQYGMCGWTANTTVAPQPYNITGLDSLPTVNGSAIGSISNGTPPLIPSPGTTPDAAGLPWNQPELHSREWDILRQAIQEQYSIEQSLTPHRTREALYYDLIDDFSGNDPYLVSIQSSERYLRDHIPGAQNVELPDLLDPLTLSSIPGDRPVLVVSSHGERASAVSVMLRLNGIDSIFLLHGMESWNYDGTARTNPCVDPEVRVNDYPLESVEH